MRKAKVVAMTSAEQYGALATMLESAGPRTMSQDDVQSVFRNMANNYRLLEAGCKQTIVTVEHMLDELPELPVAASDAIAVAKDQSIDAEYRSAKLAETAALRVNAHETTEKYACIANRMRNRDPRRRTAKQVKSDFIWIADLFDGMAANCRASKERLDGIIAALESAEPREHGREN